MCDGQVQEIGFYVKSAVQHMHFFRNFSFCVIIIKALRPIQMQIDWKRG